MAICEWLRCVGSCQGVGEVPSRSPRGHLKVLGDKLKKADWQNVQEGVDVKMAKAGGSSTSSAR